ncbi:WD40 repeat domain-containing protein [Streptomyces hokutonensis]|uniref:WD40 repeat domain-containing protein n=1 Tax=Streptomyces hokutonensis TaxID=1306990 RepID=UPI0003A83158|nr:WD40 repeat domain-containing protein [Streptomyces hokutonensis]
MTRLPDPALSRAVLIGTTTYTADGLTDLPAVANNLADLKHALTAPDLWGLPEAHCTVLQDADEPGRVHWALHQAAQEARDLLLFYYAGHGLFFDNQLALCLPSTTADNAYFAAVHYETVRRAVSERQALHTLTVLDCCYSGLAHTQSDVASALAPMLDQTKGFTFTSSAGNAVSLAPSGRRNTAFTEELLTTITLGVPSSSELLSMRDIATAVREGLLARRMPQPTTGQVNSGDQLNLVRNRAWTPTDCLPAPPNPLLDLDTLPPGERRRALADALRHLVQATPLFEPLLQALSLAPEAGVTVTDRVLAVMGGAVAGTAPADQLAISDFLSRAAPLLEEADRYGQKHVRLRYPEARGLTRVETASVERLHLRIVDALIDLAETSPGAALNPYVSHELGYHCLLAGEAAWQRLADHENVLDGLDPAATGRYAWRALSIAGQRLPADILGLLGTWHDTCPPADRRALRRVAMARHNGTRTFPTAPFGETWQVPMARLLAEPVEFGLLPGKDLHCLTVLRCDDTRALLATGGTDGAIRLFDPFSGVVDPKVLRGHEGLVTAICTVRTDRGLRAASAGFDGTVRLWDLDSGTQVGDPMRGHTSEVLAVHPLPAHPGRDRLCSVGDDSTVRFWDPDTGTEWQPPFTLWSYPNTTCRLVLPNGQVLLAVGDLEGELRLWDTGTGHYTAQLAGHTDEIRSLTAMPTPEGPPLLVSSSDDGTVRCWDPVTGSPASRLLEGGEDLDGLCPLPTSAGTALLAGCEVTGSVRFYDLANRRLLRTLGAGPGGVEAAGVVGLSDPGGSPLLVVAGEGGIRLIHDPLAAQQGNSRTRDIGATCATALPTTSGPPLLATGNLGGTVRSWDSLTGNSVGPELAWEFKQRIELLRTHRRPDGVLLLAVGHRDGVVRFWDAAEGEPLGRFAEIPDDAVLWGMCFITDAQGRLLLATSDSSGHIRLWNAPEGTPAGPAIEADKQPVDAVCSWTGPHSAPRLISSTRKGHLKVWNPDTGSCLATYQTGKEVSDLAAFRLADGREVVAVLNETGESLLLWDPATASQIGPAATGRFERPVCPVTSVDGRALLAVRGKEGLHLFDTRTMTPVRPPLNLPFDGWNMAAVGDNIAVVGESGMVLLSPPA